MSKETMLSKKTYSRSNFLISAKYRSSLLENKITAISLAKMQNVENYKREENGRLYSEFSAAELRQILNANDGSFYEQLEPVAISMKERTIGWTNPETHEFDYISFIDRAKYIDGVFTIVYSHEFEQYIMDLKKNFTILQLETMLSFKNVYAFRLYELLYSKCYVPKGVAPTNTFVYDISVSELKLNIGVVNADDERVKSVLKKNKEAPDYNAAVEAAPKEYRKYDNWSDFNKRVLTPAVKEINEKTNISVTVTPLRGGRGGKVQGISFNMKIKGLAEDAIDTEFVDEPKIELSDADKFGIHCEAMEIFGKAKLEIDYAGMVSICEAANYDISKIQRACSMIKLQTNKIDNVVGWLIACIKGNYSEPTAKEATAKGTKNKFNNFHQRDYDIDELEKSLLNS